MRVHTEAAPRVQKKTAPIVPRVEQKSTPFINQAVRGGCKHKQHRTAVKITVNAAAPERNTRSTVAPPASRKRASTKAISKSALLLQLTVSTRSKTRTGHATAIESRQSKKQMWGWTQKITRFENEVHQALAVMDEETGKLLNYKQLTNNPN